MPLDIQPLALADDLTKLKSIKVFSIRLKKRTIIKKIVQSIILWY